MYIVLGIATLLRLIFLNQSLWLDESIEALALSGKMGPLLAYSLGDYQPPLYHFVGYLWTQLAGYSEIALRTPSFVAGICTVYFLMKIGQVLRNQQLGRIIGLLAATSPLLIYYSQEGRTYALTTCLVTASMYYFIKLLRTKVPDQKSSIYYLICTILYLWTSYLSWFLLLALFLYTLYLKRYDLAKLQLLAAATLLFWLPSLIASLSIGNATRGHSPEWGRVVGGLNWKSLPLTWVKFVIGRIGFTSKIIYSIVLGITAALHGKVLKRVNFKKYTVFLVWLCTPVALGLLVAGALPIYQYFRVLFVLPAYLILLGVGLSQSPVRLTHAVIALQLFFLVIFWVTPSFHREDWRSLTRDIPASATVAMPSRGQNAPLIYYHLTRPIIEPSHETISGNTVYYIRYVEDLFDTQRLGQKNLLESGYTMTSQKFYSGIQVDIYENRN